jgi:hypothetical protein
MTVFWNKFPYINQEEGKMSVDQGRDGAEVRNKFFLPNP